MHLKSFKIIKFEIHINCFYMSTLRFNALINPAKELISPQIEDKKRSALFYELVFNDAVMVHALTTDAYKGVRDAIDHGKKIDRKIADQIAEAMKVWALSKGATHYTHWFQPLTGATAEKHDAFFEPLANGSAIERFSGGQLVQQKPDASSFPSGGIRNTFEARGYTAWDPTSPAFVYGSTLCIPTVFVSYTGEALDNKTPLLRSLHAVDEAATNVAKYFDKSVSKVNASLGWEQEYFLIDKKLANSRPDLMITGRTLIGHAPAKGQQLDDHYFGAIPSRALNFMRELEIQSLQLGIPVKTRHNEVAPNQFELAPVYEEANLAVDHNSLLMDVMEKIADKHDLKVLFHEKPFAGINGSGKHNNWSLATNTGVNLLSPGPTPMRNLQFLTFFVNTIKAVQEYEELMRAAIASAGNDHRLGANEAPPTIMSVFIGDQLTHVLDELEGVTEGKLSPEEKTDLKLNVVGKIPEILRDNTDRNRTSPFAFTGNKFEFRAVGSKLNCAKPMTVLNTIVAKQLIDFKSAVDILIDTDNLKKDEAIFNVLREYIKTSKRIRFEGDGYSDKWLKEAKKRKLSNHKNTPEALAILSKRETIALYEQMNVMSATELAARKEVELDEYTMRIQIEGRVLGDIIYNHIIPAAISYQNVLIENCSGLKNLFGENYKKQCTFQLQVIEEISNHITELKAEVDKMVAARRKANQIKDAEKKATTYLTTVKPYFETIRYHSDKLEQVVQDSIWPFAKYRELLLTK